jgi:uncharacterized membrane protein YbaN (DUF454 family)
VTSAVASELTGNILIQFHPRQTSEQKLLAELRSLSLPAPPYVPARVEPPPLDPGPAAPPGYVTGTRRRVYRALGWSSVGLAVVGAATPGIPTVPFVILAGYFFIRSSPQAHDWLLRSEWFGPMLHDWEERHVVKRSVKYTAVGLMAAGLAAAWLLGVPTGILAAIAALETIGLVVIIRLPVAETAATAQP